jgi:hypothetical protein
MKILIYLPFMAAALALFIGAFYHLRNRSRLRRWHRVVGEIVGWRTGYANRGVLYVSEVRFSTPDGRAITFISRPGRVAPPVVGSTVNVLYDPKDPARAQLNDNTFQHAVVVCLLCAAVFSIGGLPIVLR